MSDEPTDSHNRSMTLHDAWTMANFEAELESGVVVAPWLRLNDDFLAGGWRAGSTYVLAGTSKVGKTTAAQGIAATAAANGHRVHVFSPAVDRAELTRRMLSTAADVPIIALNSPRLDPPPQTRQAINTALERIGDRVSIIDDYGLTIGRLYADAQIEIQQRGCELIVIDHVHAVKAGNSALTDDEQLELVMSELARMAKQLKVPVIVLARPEQDTGDTLERFGAVVMLLSTVTGEDQDNLVDVDIIKNRFGPLGSVRWRADFDRQRFEEL